MRGDLKEVGMQFSDVIGFWQLLILFIYFLINKSSNYDQNKLHNFPKDSLYF